MHNALKHIAKKYADKTVKGSRLLAMYSVKLMCSQDPCNNPLQSEHALQQGLDNTQEAPALVQYLT